MSFQKLLVAPCHTQNEIHVPLCDVQRPGQLSRPPSFSLLFSVHSSLTLREVSCLSCLSAFDHADSSPYISLPSSLPANILNMLQELF